MRIRTTLFLLLCHVVVAPLGATPIAATIETTDERTIGCFVISATEDAIRFSMSETGAAPQNISRSGVKTVVMRAPEGWGDAEAIFNAGNYEEAERLFANFSEEYRGIRLLEDQFGSMAEFYLFKCLVANEKFDVLAERLLDLRQNPIRLSEVYMREMILMAAWSLYGSENWTNLNTYLERFQAEDVPDGLPFVPLHAPTPELTASAYLLRGAARRGLGDGVSALDDFSRAISVARGKPVAVVEKATLAALETLHEQASSIEEPSYVTKAELHALAISYRDLYGGGEVPPAFRPYLVPPPKPESDDEGGATSVDEAARAAEGEEGEMEGDAAMEEGADAGDAGDAPDADADAADAGDAPDAAE